MVDAEAVHVLDPPLRAPRAVVDGAEELIAGHDGGVTGIARVEPRPLVERPLVGLPDEMTHLQQGAHRVERSGPELLPGAHGIGLVGAEPVVGEEDLLVDHVSQLLVVSGLGSGALFIDLTNTGGVTFESISMTVRDRDTDVVVSMYTDVFHDIDGCSDTSTRDRLNPGDSRVVSGPIFTYNPTGGCS